MRSLAAEVVNVRNEESSVDGWGNGASWARRDARTVLRGIGILGRGGRIGKVVVTAMGRAGRIDDSIKPATLGRNSKKLGSPWITSGSSIIQSHQCAPINRLTLA